MFDPTRLIFDLQKVNTIIQEISGCLDPKKIANTITDALVAEFNCAFVRIWLVEPNGQFLNLVSSSGLYTHTNGSFARVPMGAYKVGKIAKNCIPFLSNNLAEEAWVKDRNWAITHQIRGFAGYPLAKHNGAIGVLAAFSHDPFLPEFLEILQVLCMAVTIALDSAIIVQHRQLTAANSPHQFSSKYPCLSDHLSSRLSSTNLSLVGTEHSLTTGLAYLLLQTTEILNQLNCSYCRLTYGDRSVALESIVAVSHIDSEHIQFWWRSHFRDIEMLANHLGGTLQTQLEHHQQVIQLSLHLPYPRCEVNPEADKLSPREKQVMSLLAKGFRDRDIAQQLHISESTVKFHLNGTLAKLDAKNRYHAIYKATAQGLI